MPILRHCTRDGGLIQFGPSFYCLARMADPMERVTVVGAAEAGHSLIDGVSVARFVVRSERGVEFVVEAWQLSRIPPDELYRQLRAQGSSMRVPVTSVRLAG